MSMDMHCYFSDDRINELKKEKANALVDCKEIIRAISRYNFQTKAGGEFAINGINRRLFQMLHSIDLVYQNIPLDLVKPPEEQNRQTATIALQSFVINVVGTIENVAQVWAFERQIIGKYGKLVSGKEIGFFNRSDNRSILASLKKDTQSKILPFRKWHKKYTKFYRDSLAHRTPLYIPPFSVPQKHKKVYLDLEISRREANIRGDMEEADRITTNQMKLYHWQPLMLYSFDTDQAEPIVFHAQTIVDLKTVSSICRLIFDELNQLSK